MIIQSIKRNEEIEQNNVRKFLQIYYKLRRKKQKNNACHAI